MLWWLARAASARGRLTSFIEPDSGALIARRAVQAVVCEAIKEGVVYLQDLVGTPTGDRWLDWIMTGRGQRISAGSYIFACGPWLPKIFPSLLRDRIQPTRQ